MSDVEITDVGLLYRRPPGVESDWYSSGETVGEAAAFAAQLEGLGHATPDSEGNLLVPWSGVYWALAEDDLSPSITALPIPAIDSNIVPALDSRGTLSDPSFTIAISAWHRRELGPLAQPPTFTGPVGPAYTLSEPAYKLTTAVREFQNRPSTQRTPEDNRLGWGEIRALAIAAGAKLGSFLRETIVLRPHTLALQFERLQNGDDLAVHMRPTFPQAPEGWDKAFARSRPGTRVYRVVSSDGYHEIVAEDSVAQVLDEIRRTRGVVVGDRARRLVENPFAFFEDAEDVFDEEAVEEALNQLREGTYRFRPKVDLEPDGSIRAVGIEAEPLDAKGDVSVEVRLFSNPESLAVFCERLRSGLEERRTFAAWSGLQLELDGNAEQHLSSLDDLRAAWAEGRTASTDSSSEDETTFRVTADLVLDLGRYTDRVEGIGIETPYGIISIPLSKKGAWLPEDEEMQILLAGAEEPLSFDRDELADFVRATRAAEEAGASNVRTARGRDVPTDKARDFVDALPKALVDEVVGGASPEAAAKKERAAPTPRTGLLIGSNVDDADYVTRRSSSLRPDDGAVALVPSSLRNGVALKEHQLDGLLWMQHLFTQSPKLCRGALLADDMGLGKTLQTLALIARAREDDPDLAPALVVAPVTLLDNWAQEVERFFEPASLPVRTLYGAGLREFKVGRHQIDARLQAEGLKRFLRPGWADVAIVLTTYETLRDYEFSFGEVEWSIVVCDEAQRIKNPNALVSRAAKKLKARFCIAATGTPVENNLTDLWSLFDFIQPGLLEPLNRFNRNYRRPIEAKTDAEKARLADLRDLIEPQIKRRLKSDVARDLPEKRLDETARRLRMSSRQRDLYQTVLSAQNVSRDISSNGTEILELISRLRRICTDPRSGSELAAPLPPLAEYRQISPKLDWLMRTLEAIQARDEKAIIFIDRRDIQRLVQAYVRERFGFSPEIINGETPTTGPKDSRQARVDHFQAKPGFYVMILSPIAAGVGLNIQAANHVIHYMRHWNPAKEDQATDRSYRIGQTRDVTVYTPIVTGDGFVSFDERLDELLEKKRAIALDVLNGADDAGAAEFADLLV